MDPKDQDTVPSSPNATGRIGFVIGSMLRGGTELHLLQLLPVLKSRGWNVSVFLIGRSGPVAAELQEFGIDIAPKNFVQMPDWLPVWLIRAIRLILLIPKFLLFAIKHRHGVIHFFLPEAVIIGGLLTFFWHPRLAMSRRGLITYRSRYPAPIIFVERFLQRRMALLLGNSNAVVKELLADGAPPDRVRLIYNGLTADRIDPSGVNRKKLRRDLKISQSDLVFIILANLHPYKGHMDLIRALGELKDAGRLSRDWTLLLIGRDIPFQGSEFQRSNTSYRTVLENESEILGISSHLKFLGERDNAPALLRCADIAVFPSHEEGFSNALLEQMAAGLGIVASDVGGNGEALDGGNAGIVVPSRDPSRLAKAIGDLIDDPEMSRSLGKAARARVLDQFQMDRCASNYEEAYRDLLGKRPVSETR